MNSIQHVVGRFRHRINGIFFILFPIVLTGLVLRILLAVSVWPDLQGADTLLVAIVTGFFLDLVYASYVAVPALLYLLLVPQRLFASRIQRLASWMYFFCLWWLVFFQAVAEWVFWDEFGVRFNFIAVDYLVYTTEVIDNIVQSYPIGNTQGLTPRLDALMKDSLVFTNFMATGTRTVRGMEALALSVPPTPGQSIIKRPNIDNLFTIGTVFRDKGYKTSFIYGGRGYFDNMNAFFSGNGFEIHDQASESADEVVFSNAWGVSDEDLYGWVMQQADKSAAEGQPFYYFVMTTSNHRPYTFPEGRIDLPSHSGRAAAVKYTDYAIGQFIDEARRKPWFDNTIFVIVADHCANSAGKTDVPVDNYHIPLVMYAPSIIAPREVDTLSSQIDYAPTLFELLGWYYVSQFYGKDILAMQPEEGRALLGTYESLGLYRNNKLTLLKPLQLAEAYDYDPLSKMQQRGEIDADDYLDAIAYYQSAAEDPGVAAEPQTLLSWSTSSTGH
jgi:hypothetical protein